MYMKYRVLGGMKCGKVVERSDEIPFESMETYGYIWGSPAVQTTQRCAY